MPLSRIGATDRDTSITGMRHGPEINSEDSAHVPRAAYRLHVRARARASSAFEPIASAHRHAPVSMHLGLGEDAQVGVRLRQCAGRVREHGFALSHSTTIAWLAAAASPAESRVPHALRSPACPGSRAHAMRTRSAAARPSSPCPYRAGAGDLIEQHRTVGQHEQLHAEHAPSVLACRVGLADQPLDAVRAMRRACTSTAASVAAGARTRGSRRSPDAVRSARRSQCLRTSSRSARSARNPTGPAPPRSRVRRSPSPAARRPGQRFHPRRVDAIGGTHHRLGRVRTSSSPA